MIKSPPVFTPLRIIMAMVLLLFAFKIASPLITLKYDAKEFGYATVADDTGEDVKAEKTWEKDVEFIHLYEPFTAFIQPFPAKTLTLTYLVSYTTAYFQQITVPPPDRSLSPLA